MKKKTRRNFGQILAMLEFFLMGAACGVLISRCMLQSEQGEQSVGAQLLICGMLLLGMYAFLMLHFALHEAGHLVFGWLTGYRFCSYRLGSLMLIRENGRLRLRRLHLAGTGGQCLMSPPEPENGRIPYVLYNLGGCIANLTGGVLCAAASRLFAQGSIGETLLLMGAVTGILQAAVNGIPLRLGMVNNDGSNIRAIGKSPAAMRAFWIQMQVNACNAQGIPLREMPPEWFEMPPEAELQNPITATMAVLACNRLMEEQRFAEADAQMAKLLASDAAIVDLHRSLLICDRLYCELTAENRSDVVDALLTRQQLQFLRGMRSFPAVLRTDYVLALFHTRDPERAEQALTAFARRAKSYPYPCEIESERNLMTRAAQIAQQTSAEV